MSLNGPQTRKLVEALISAFPRPADLKQMLYFGMDTNLDAVAGGGNQLEVAFNLVQWTESQGRTADLIRAALQANPGNPHLKSVAAELTGGTSGSAPVEASQATSRTASGGNQGGTVATGARDEPADAPSAEKSDSQQIAWLHLTDLHFGQKNQKWLWPTVREEFFDDLTRLHRKSGPWDLVLFSGDLAYSGSEYDGFDSAMAELWKHLRGLGSDPVLLAVPGNHDVVWPNAKGAVYRALKAWNQDEELRGLFWDDPQSEYRALVDTAFAGYAKWWGSINHPSHVSLQHGMLPGDFAATVVVRGLRVGIMGLNSGFLQLGKGFTEGSMDLDPRQMYAACGDQANWARSHHVNLLMTHHPPAWLCEDARKKLRSEIAPAGRFALHFYGHMHEAKTSFERIGGSPTSRPLQGASLFGLESWEDAGGKHVQRIHGYSAGRIAVKGRNADLAIWPRVLQETQGGRRKMVPDHSFDLDENEAYTDVFKVTPPVGT